MMKKISFMIFALLGTAAQAQTPGPVVEGVSVDDVTLEHSGRYLEVQMDIDLRDLSVDRNRAVLLTPRLKNGGDSLDLPAVGIYGRNRYYHYLRNGDMLSGKDERSFKASAKPDSIAYRHTVDYADWMDGAALTLHRSDYGCCHTLLARQDGELGRHTEEFFPVLVYEQPQTKAIKSRALEGSAFIDFPVDQTVIYPEYRRNTAELGKIQATIDSVRDDSDITITQVWLKGYASPESPYSHNKELAQGRTEALKNYIRQLYKFDDGIIVTDYEPEDWAGLRRYVERSNLDHREEILAMIDSDLEPDAKEAAIKRSYPEQYRFLLQNCYPALRHTDYRIAYTIRSYSDASEIARVMQEAPQKLSLDEFHVVAQEYEPGSDGFTEVFETAVRMYPNDALANLNAANAAMRRGDLEAAARYLEKAGDSPEAIYARGSLAIRMKDYDTARRYLEEAKALGVTQAAITLDELDNGRR